MFLVVLQSDLTGESWPRSTPQQVLWDFPLALAGGLTSRAQLPAVGGSVQSA